MSKQQTAVEWVVEQIIRKHSIITQFLPNSNFDKEIIEQAKAMEKEQIINAYRVGKTEVNIPPEKLTTGQQYYNETFKNESE